MKKILLLLVLLLAVACGGPEAPVTEATDNEESETAVSTPTTATEEVATAETIATAETVAPTNADTSSSSRDDFTPASTPADAGIVRDFDQVKGATDPTVTIIEYGDYQ